MMLDQTEVAKKQYVALTQARYSFRRAFETLDKILSFGDARAASFVLDIERAVGQARFGLASIEPLSLSCNPCTDTRERSCL